MQKFHGFALMACGLFSSLGIFALTGAAAERPTLVKTCDPRPDILPRPIYENWPEYRACYNRPRYITGWMAWELSRTSQEAMAWQENLCAGNYDCKHMPPMYKSYMYPKPWEVLATGARVNTNAKKTSGIVSPAPLDSQEAGTNGASSEPRGMVQPATEPVVPSPGNQ